MKESLIFYLSQYQAIACLTNEQLGRLFRLIFEKQLGKEVVLDDDIKIAFNFINNQLVVDNKKYDEKVAKLRSNAKKGGAPKGNKNAKKQQNNQNNQIGSDNVNDNVNVNVNDNVNNIYTPSEQSSSGDVAKASKHKYGKYKNVLLKDEELQALKRDYANCDELIEYLDEYIEMKGYKAKSHYLAIKKWVVDAAKKNSNTSNTYHVDNGYTDLSKFYMN